MGGGKGEREGREEWYLSIPCGNTSGLEHDAAVTSPHAAAVPIEAAPHPGRGLVDQATAAASSAERSETVRPRPAARTRRAAKNLVKQFLANRSAEDAGSDNAGTETAQGTGLALPTASPPPGHPERTAVKEAVITHRQLKGQLKYYNAQRLALRGYMAGDAGGARSFNAEQSIGPRGLTVWDRVNENRKRKWAIRRYNCLKDYRHAVAQEEEDDAAAKQVP